MPFSGSSMNNLNSASRYLPSPYGYWERPNVPTVFPLSSMTSHLCALTTCGTLSSRKSHRRKDLVCYESARKGENSTNSQAQQMMMLSHISSRPSVKFESALLSPKLERYHLHYFTREILVNSPERANACRFRQILLSFVILTLEYFVDDN